jgi:mRNA interferase RelE/StbE
VAAYTIDVRPRARRSLRQLDPSVRKAIAVVIDGLATDPRPPGVLPLTGHRPYLRVRSGDYRVIYAVDDRARTVAQPSYPRLSAVVRTGRGSN